MSETEEEERFLRLTQKDYATICHCMMLAYTLAPRVYGRDECLKYLPNHWSENLEAVGPNNSGSEIQFRSNLEVGRKRKIYHRHTPRQRI